jgi:hypothetical protein
MIDFFSKAFRAFGSFAMKLFQWDVLKVIGGSYLSAFTIVVPLFGYLIFFGEFSNGVFSIDFKNLIHLDVVYQGEIPLLRLKFTYVGLSLIGFTTIIFRVFCPKEISAYKDQRDYVESSTRTVYMQSLGRLRDDVVKGCWYSWMIPDVDAVSLAEIKNVSSHVGRGDFTLQRSDWLEKNLDSINLVLSLTYQIRNLSKIPIRILIIAGYAVGFILTIIPSLMVFIPIVGQLIRFLGNSQS